MGAMASQMTSLTIVYSTIYSGADQRKHQSSASLVFARGIQQWPVNSPHKWPVTRKCFHLMMSSYSTVRCATCTNSLSFALFFLTLEGKTVVMHQEVNFVFVDHMLQEHMRTQMLVNILSSIYKARNGNVKTPSFVFFGMCEISTWIFWNMHMFSNMIMKQVASGKLVINW